MWENLIVIGLVLAALAGLGRAAWTALRRPSRSACCCPLADRKTHCASAHRHGAV